MPRHAALLPAVALLAACASTPEADPRYRPAENILEVVAVLRQHVPDDTYRFEPARDYTGRNVYRSSLLRLESLERVHEAALRAGHLDGVLYFAKARSLERLRAFDLAAESYRLAAEREEELALEALRSADLCDALHAANRIGSDLAAPGGGPGGPEAEPERALAAFERRAERLDDLLAAAEGTHHEAVVREEIEHADMARAAWFNGMRKALPNGDVRAVAELQRVAQEHRDSKNRHRHLLALADLYAQLAEEYANANPPESLLFDPASFQELVDAAARLYEMVAHRDGTPEKLEASRRLEAFMAFALRIDRDRFTP